MGSKRDTIQWVFPTGPFSYREMLPLLPKESGEQEAQHKLAVINNSAHTVAIKGSWECKHYMAL